MGISVEVAISSVGDILSSEENVVSIVVVF